MTYDAPERPPESAYQDETGDSGEPVDYRLAMTMRLVTAIEGLARALDRNTEALGNAPRGPQTAPGSPPSASAPPPGRLPPPSAGNGPDPVRMGKKVFAICKQQGWDIGAIGTQILGYQVGADSRRWTPDELSAVLDQFKEWGHG